VFVAHCLRIAVLDPQGRVRAKQSGRIRARCAVAAGTQFPCFAGFISTKVRILTQKQYKNADTDAEAALQEKLNEIQTCYEYKFIKFSETHYKDSSWPHADAVLQVVEGDEVFLMLYKELYFRQLHLRLGPNVTLEQVCVSASECECVYVSV